MKNLLKNVTVIPIYSAIYKYGKEKARLGALGSNISDFDLLIGCTAVENELIKMDKCERKGIFHILGNPFIRQNKTSF